ncbi:PTS sugar transporter subunit IIA [Oenococcus alcoholitolerans]|uniref:PTS sugar transporter subunit IIA n=1 Tax=Oenococcus alcoholitolerans TaxID=931074 RepID=UPI003F6FB766
MSGDSESLDRSFFAKLIPKNILQKSYQVLQETQLTNKTRSDVQEVQLVLILSISLLRLQKHALQKYPIKEPQNLFKYRREALSIFQKYNPAIKSKVTTAEIDFLSARFKALDYWVDPRSWDNFFDLKVNLLVKKLIQLVSDQVGWNFSRDINLFSRLSSHISLLLRHNDMSFPADKVGTLDEVSDKYPELLDAISDGLSKTFQNNYFPNAEKDLILLYFANSFENSENINGLRALVICANGLGAASILKNRLKQEVPIVSDVEIAKVSHLQKIDPSKFDLILSTIDLPGSDWNYLIVSPLLLSNEIAKVKDYVSKIKKTAVKHFNLKNVAQDPASSSVYLSNMSKQIDLSQKLLSEIKLEQIDYKGKTDLKDILQKILSIIPTDLISNKKTVIEKMLKRVDQAPVGIPDSSVALIHTTDSSVKFPFFSIYQLQHPIMMKSMDYQNIQIKRILLMAAPDSMDGFENNLMASISSSIVSSHHNLEIYQKADQATIKDLIADQFLKQIEINKESELSQ